MDKINEEKKVVKEIIDVVNKLHIIKKTKNYKPITDIQILAKTEKDETPIDIRIKKFECWLKIKKDLLFSMQYPELHFDFEPPKSFFSSLINLIKHHIIISLGYI